MEVHVVVLAEWSRVEEAGEEDVTTRHDIHQQASPPPWERALRERLARRLPARRRKALLSRHLHWLPPLPPRDYLSLLYHAGATLDP